MVTNNSRPIRNQITLNPFEITLIPTDEDFSEKVDILYSSMVLHHIKDINYILAKFYNMLENNGYLVLVDLDKEDGRFHLNYPDYDGHKGFDQAQLKMTLEEIGFRDVSSYTFYQDVKRINDEEIHYSLFIMIARK